MYQDNTRRSALPFSWRVFQEFGSGGAVVHRRAADETKTGEGYDLTDAGVAFMDEKAG